MNRRRVPLVRGVVVLFASVAIALAVHGDSAGFLRDQFWSSTPMTQAQAIQQAELESKGNRPSMSMLEARVDEVTAELISSGEAWRRMGESGIPSEGWTYHLTDPVWWVSVRGYFRYASGPAPQNGISPVYEARDRVFVYDANTGYSMSYRTYGALATTPAAGR